MNGKQKLNFYKKNKVSLLESEILNGTIYFCENNEIEVTETNLTLVLNAIREAKAQILMLNFSNYEKV